jgi:hypothetical protein
MTLGPGTIRNSAVAAVKTRKVEASGTAAD